MKSNFAFNYSISTAKGTRDIQEDASWFGTNKSNEAMAIVCDGIGSQDDSQIASLMTVEVFKKAFEKHSKVRNINV
ncbi:hypothetical protein FACS1894166_04040 [Bacilli bacterium]|nr:hypothetical protein FACS1894166_04040 [Bacilli bacterium]